MDVLSVYLRLYADCLARAGRGLRKNAWTLLLPGALLIAMGLAATLVGLLGIPFLGGLLVAFAGTALLSSYLTFLDGIVSLERVQLAGLRQSFVRLFWPVMGVGFVLWIASFVIGYLAQGPGAGAIRLLYNLAVLLLVVVNPTAEVIYRRGMSSGLATLQHSFAFIQANWIEWYVPNLLIGAAVWLAAPRVLALGLFGLVAELVLGALLHVAMVFRGHLYVALDGTSHRQRMFRYRTGM